MQDQVVGLLQDSPGQPSKFDVRGFPAAGRALNNRPPGLRSQTAQEREEAIRLSNMVREHAVAISNVAKAAGVIILFRPVNPDIMALIQADIATKGMHVKGKSSNWGPQAGYIAADQAAILLKDTKLDTDKKLREIGNYNCEVKSSTEPKSGSADPSPEPKPKTLMVPPGTQDYAEVHKLEKEGSLLPGSTSARRRRRRPALFVARLKERMGTLLNAQGAEPKLFLYRASTRTYHDPKKPEQTLTPAGTDGAAAGAGGLRKLTSTLRQTTTSSRSGPGRRWRRSPGEPDQERGFITPSQIKLLNSINAAVAAKGYGGGNVVHHGPENQFRCSGGADFPIAVFEPDGSIRTIRSFRRRGRREEAPRGRRTCTSNATSSD